ncbi:MAG: hypothetical protein CSA95_00090 [Bacteroidetes bacterium]|nr:MAG: hypothetical protein CSA95_00090 [Bacteroidota bacterium]
MNTPPLIKAYTLLIALLVLPFISAWGQDTESLKRDKKRLEKDIRIANELLKQTTTDRKASLAQIALLDQKITSRKKLIKTLNRELKTINTHINQLNDSISYYHTRLDHLKESYAKMVVHAYETRSLYQRMIYLFAANDLNQAYRRMQYYKSYGEARKKQAKQIQQATQRLEGVKKEVEQQREEQLNLIHRKETENVALNGEKKEKTNAVSQLQKKERKLRKQIKEKQRAAKRLAKEIEKIIHEEIKKANNGTRASAFKLTPEEALLSDDFAKNKGKLPWPSERGILSSSYGEHAHAVLKHVKVRNNGIDILTEKNALARAIFKGEVTRIIKVPQHNNVVIIRHGEYLSVYSNLNEVFVTEGSEVEALSTIGTAFTHPDSNETLLHLEIWKGSTSLNPQSWLAK